MTTPRRPLRVGMLPVFELNPYQSLLHAALRARGVVVEELRGVGALGRALRRRALDVVHLHWVFPFYVKGRLPGALRGAASLVGALALARASGVRVVHTAHNLSDHEGRRPTLDAAVRVAVAEVAQTVILHSEPARRDWLARFGRRHAPKTRVIPHAHYDGVYAAPPSDARHRLGVPPGALTIGFVGGIREYKRVGALAEAFARLRRQVPDAYLLVAGQVRGRELERRLPPLLAALEGARCELRYVPDDELTTWLAASDIVALPYAESLTSGAAVLAASYGRPILGPRKSGTEAVAGSDGGILYDASDEGGLDRALREAAARRAELAAMGARARARVLEWGWPRVAEATEAAYRGALTDGSQ